MEALRTVLVLAAARAARAAKECIILMIMNCRYSVEPCENAAGTAELGEGVGFSALP